MSDFLEAQQQFAQMAALLIQKAHQWGYDVTLGDAYRDASCHYGSRSSRHRMRLAIDLNLFLEGEYLTETEDHKRLGEWWEELGGIWGGRFQDGNHYEWPLKPQFGEAEVKTYLNPDAAKKAEVK